MKSKMILQCLGIGILLFVLLIIGGWAFVAGIGLLFARGYYKTKNRGLLLAAASFLGLGLGFGLEMLLAREGGVAMMLGIALGLFGMAFILWRESETISFFAIGLSLCLLGLTAILWSFSIDKLSLYLSVFPFGILALLLLAAYQYWRDRAALA